MSKLSMFGPRRHDDVREGAPGCERSLRANWGLRAIVLAILLFAGIAVASTLAFGAAPQDAYADETYTVGSVAGGLSNDSGSLQAQDGNVAYDLIIQVPAHDSRVYAPDGGNVSFAFSLDSSNGGIVPTIVVSGDAPRFVAPTEIDQETQNDMYQAVGDRINELQQQGIDISSINVTIPHWWAVSSTVYVRDGYQAQYAGHIQLEFAEGYDVSSSIIQWFSLGDALGSVDFSNITCSYSSPSSVPGLPAFNDSYYLTQITLPTTGEWLISSYTFSESRIESIYIPNSIVEIEGGAFDDCKNLKTVTFQEGSKLTRINGFSGCTNLNASAVLASMPNTVTAIGTVDCGRYSNPVGAFSGCSFPDGIVIPEGVTSIGADAFRGATGLDGATVVVPASVTTVGDSAFAFGAGQETPPSATFVFENADMSFSEAPTSTYQDLGRNRARIDGVEYANPFGDTVVSIVAPAYGGNGEASFVKRFYTDGEVLHGTGDDAEWVPTSEAELPGGAKEYTLSSPASPQASFEATGNALMIPSSRVTVGEPFTVKAYYQLEDGATSGTVGFSVPSGVEVLSISDSDRKLSTGSTSASVSANAGVLYVRMQASEPGVHMLGMRLDGGDVVATSFAKVAGVYIEGHAQDRSVLRGINLSVRAAPETEVSVAVTGGDTVTATTNKRGLAKVTISAPEEAVSTGNVHVAVTAGADTVEDDLPYSSVLQLWDFGFEHGSERVAFVQGGSSWGVSYYRSYSNEPTADQADWNLFVTIRSNESSLGTVHVTLNSDATGSTEPDCSFDLTLVSSELVDGMYVYTYTGTYRDMAYLEDALAFEETGDVAMALYFAIERAELSVVPSSGGEATNMLLWSFGIRGIMDPSGIVYEGVPTNPLSGVTATVYRSDDEPAAGDVTSGERWDAENYDQVNPQTTDGEGSYAWDVPDGFYQVRFAKEGYVPAATDWMEVQPPRFGLATPLVYKGAATVQQVDVDPETGVVEIAFDRHVDTASGSVLVNGTAVDSGRLTWLDATTAPVYEVDGDSAEQAGTASLSRVVRVAPPEDGWPAASISVKASGFEGYNGVAVPEYSSTQTVPYDVKSYQVTFDTGGGTAIAPVQVTEGQAVSAPDPAPERAGYRFDHWYAGDSDAGAYDFSTPVTGALTLHAKWVKLWKVTASSANSSQGTVKIGSRDAAASDHVTADEGSSVSVTAVPATGYHFAAWSENGSVLPGAGATYSTGNLSADRALVATFERDFVPVSMVTGVPASGVAGTDLALVGSVSPANATNSTIAWSLVNAGGTGVALTDAGVLTGATAAGTVTVRATVANGASATTDFTQDFQIALGAPPEPGRVVVSFDTGGGTVISPVEVTEGSAVSAPPQDPKKLGCRFEYWYAGSDSSTAYDFSTPVNGSMTLHAKWTEGVTATVTVSGESGGAVVGGTVTGAGSYPVGTYVTLTAVPDENYTFAGWKADGELEILSAMDAASGFLSRLLGAMGGDAYLSTASTISFYADEDVAIQAVFEAASTDPATGGGSGSGTEGSGTEGGSGSGTEGSGTEGGGSGTGGSGSGGTTDSSTGTGGTSGTTDGAGGTTGSGSGSTAGSGTTADGSGSGSTGTAGDAGATKATPASAAVAAGTGANASGTSSSANTGDATAPLAIGLLVLTVAAAAGAVYARRRS